MQKQETVLIIELSEALAELECLVLTGAGYQAISSLCGLSSMQAVEANNPDAIVLDLVHTTNPAAGSSWATFART